MSRVVDLNADLGEGCPWDAELLPLISSCSLSCGAHAGDPVTIRRTLDGAFQQGVVVGLHPGYADREGFGRRDEIHRSADVARLILRQVRAITVQLAVAPATWRFLKPHGALYNQAQRDARYALGVVLAARELDLPVLGQPGGQVEAWAARADVRFVAEGFADRRYDLRGRLVPRAHPGALLTEPREIEEQVLRLVERPIDSLCIHGDQGHSIRLAAFVRDVLLGHGVVVRSFVGASGA